MTPMNQLWAMRYELWVYVKIIDRALNLTIEIYDIKIRLVTKELIARSFYKEQAPCKVDFRFLFGYLLVNGDL